MQLNMATRGKVGKRDLKGDSFVLCHGENGQEYFTLKLNEQTKNHKNYNESNKEKLRGFIYSIPGNPVCPILSLKKYISKIPEAAAPSFYLHPRRT